MRGYVLAPASRKHGVVAVMNKDSALELFALEDGPCASADPVSFIGPAEGEFHGERAVALADPIVEIGVYRITRHSRTGESVLERSENSV